LDLFLQIFIFPSFDSDWDSNGNGIYGEYPGDDVDFIPEIAIGRIPADNEQGFLNAFNKIISYKENYSPALEKACMVGENLNWNPVTWGGDYKDDIKSRIPAENYHFYTLFQRDGTYSEDAVFDMINEGCGIMNHMGHTNYYILMGMTPSIADQFTNDEYGMIYSQGCYPAALDEQTSHTGEAVGERLMIAESALMAFVGNTRYGWYAPGSIEGASQQFDRTFFDGLYSEEIRKLGDCNNYSKIQLINTVNVGVMRWCFYELILFGDPDCEIIVTDGIFPYLKPAQISYDDSAGDNDGTINPGEEIAMYVEIENLPEWQVAFDVTLTMQYNGEDITIIDSTSEYGHIVPGGAVSNEDDPIVFHVSEDCSLGEVNFDLVITANNSSPHPFEKTYSRHFSLSIEQTNFPKYLGYQVNCSPLIFDFDDDGENELILVDGNGNVYSLESDATVSAGFPINLNTEVRTSMAVGDINNDEEYEMALTTYDGRIYVIDKEGSILFEYISGETMNCTPALADIDEDDNLEIIATSIYGKLFVINSVGEDYPGFPFEIGSSISTDAAVGDINSDGNIDFVFATNDGKLYVVDENADILDGFPT